MKKILTVLVLALAFSGLASAQNAAPQVFIAQHLTWDQAGPDLATVQGYSYQYFPDGAQTGAALVGVTCTGTASPFQCSVPLPAFTPGAHSLTLKASNPAGVSAASSAITFTFVVAPQAPANLAIK